MKIGIMLRHISEKGGIAVYTKNILRSLLSIDSTNEYFLLMNAKDTIFPMPKNPLSNLVILSARTEMMYDQYLVPRMANLLGLDIIFNPKLSVPLHRIFRALFLVSYYNAGSSPIFVLFL